jgi:hypothetical protein
MLQIGNTLVSLDLLEQAFVCDLERCKGACCVEGDSGAPLDESELAALDNCWEGVKALLPAENVKEIERQGLYLRDADGDWTTPLMGGHRECAFTLFENGIAKCGIEKAWQQGASTFRKPVSCHLYPVRINKLNQADAVNYHRWSICKPACRLGDKLQVPLYVFLKEALIRKYGQEWYEELELVAGEYSKHRP